MRVLRAGPRLQLQRTGYAVDDLRGRLCPWCIADGNAAERFDADFTDVLDDVPPDVLHVVARRTPGFTGWQQERWLFHCGDGAAFLGAVGTGELTRYPEALACLRQELADYLWPPAQTEAFLSALSKEGHPTAYLFECRSCGTHLAYSDFT